MRQTRKELSRNVIIRQKKTFFYLMNTFLGTVAYIFLHESLGVLGLILFLFLLIGYWKISFNQMRTECSKKMLGMFVGGI